MANHRLLDEIKRFDAAHNALCSTLDRLRRVAWVAQGAPVCGTALHMGPGFHAFMTVKPTDVMAKVSAAIDRVDHRIGVLDEQYQDSLIPEWARDSEVGES